MPKKYDRNAVRVTFTDGKSVSLQWTNDDKSSDAVIGTTRLSYEEAKALADNLELFLDQSRKERIKNQAGMMPYLQPAPGPAPQEGLIWDASKAAWVPDPYSRHPVLSNEELSEDELLEQRQQRGRDAVETFLEAMYGESTDLHDSEFDVDGRPDATSFPEPDDVPLTVSSGPVPSPMW